MSNHRSMPDPMDDLLLFGRRITPGAMFVGVFALAFALRFAIVLCGGHLYDIGWEEVERVARTLAQEGRYADPFLSSTGPTAHVAPGYTLILALIFKFFGTDALGAAVKQVVSCAVSAVCAALVPLLVLRAGLGRRVALVAATLGVVWISALNAQTRGNFGGPWEGLLLVVLIWAAYERPVKNWSLREAALHGAGWGLLALFNPVAVTLLAALLVIECYRQRRAFFMLVPRLTVLAAAAVLVMAPWAFRNHMVMGRWIWTRSNMGLVLRNSFHEGAYYDMTRNIQSPVSRHLLSSSEEVAVVRTMGETSYNDYQRTLAVAYIRAHPAESLRLVVTRVARFWFPPGRNMAHGAVRWVFTLLAIAGVPLLWRSNRRLALLVSVVLAVFPLIYYLLQWSSRYRVPIEWALVLLVSLTLARVSERRGDRPQP